MPAYDAVQNPASKLAAAEEIDVILVSAHECLEMVRLGRFANVAPIVMLIMGLERAGLLKTEALGRDVL